MHVECKNKSDTSNNWGYWNHRKLLQKISDQHTGKHKIQELKKQPYYIYTVHMLRKVLMWIYKKYGMGMNIKCTIKCTYRAAATLYTLETRSVSGT